MNDDKQKLINVVFEIGLTVKKYFSRFQNMDDETFCRWIADHLRQIGFDTEPMGASWGVMKKGTSEMTMGSHELVEKLRSMVVDLYEYVELEGTVTHKKLEVINEEGVF